MLWRLPVTVTAFLFFTVPAGGQVPVAAGWPDSDRDGLSDLFEQSLLKRFVPAWRVSALECDGLPAEFRPGTRKPQVLARNGTIYGQVFPAAHPQPGQEEFEIHYYHLWSRDCGMAGHDWDVEHVSALVTADQTQPAGAAYRAVYWYAAAHRGTPCDASSGAKAADLDAELRGPTIWISIGKHASFFREEDCRGGCGGDRCTSMTDLISHRILNLGERGAPMNGAEWAADPAWPLFDRMAADFSPELLARLESSGSSGIVPAHNALPPVKAVFLAGGDTLGAAATGKRETGSALGAAGTRFRRVLHRSLGAVGRFLGNAVGSNGSNPASSPSGAGIDRKQQ